MGVMNIEQGAAVIRARQCAIGRERKLIHGQERGRVVPTVGLFAELEAGALYLEADNAAEETVVGFRHLKFIPVAST
jgi:hypothetical protein